MRNNPLAAALIIIIAIAGLLSYNASVNMIDHVNTKHINGLNHSPFENLSLDTVTKPFTKVYDKVNSFLFTESNDSNLTMMIADNTTKVAKMRFKLENNLSLVTLGTINSTNTSNFTNVNTNKIRGDLK